MNRILIIYSPNESHIISIINANKNGMKNRNLIYKIYKFNNTAVKLVGYDGIIKAEYNEFTNDILKEIFKKIDNMPMRSMDEKIRNYRQMGGNLRLYTDDTPKYTIKGLGFKNTELAIYSINLIRNRSILYQQTTINALYHRAKHHPNITKDIKKATSVLKNGYE